MFYMQCYHINLFQKQPKMNLVENLSLISLQSRSRTLVLQLFHLSNSRVTALFNSQLTCLEPE